MVPRSFISNIKAGDALSAGASTLARSIALGGDSGVARVDFSSDDGQLWQQAQLGKDEGKYSFRQWQINFVVPGKGSRVLMVRCTNTSGETQAATPIWNPEGFMLNDIERTASSRPEKEKVLRQRLPLVFVALSALWALAAHAEDRIPLKSVNVEIPFGDRMFEGLARTSPTTIASPATLPEWCSISPRCRRCSGAPRLKRCAQPTKRRSIPRTLTRLLRISFPSKVRNKTYPPANNEQPVG